MWKVFLSYKYLSKIILRSYRMNWFKSICVENYYSIIFIFHLFSFHSSIFVQFLRLMRSPKLWERFAFVFFILLTFFFPVISLLFPILFCDFHPFSFRVFFSYIVLFYLFIISSVDLCFNISVFRYLKNKYRRNV